MDSTVRFSNRVKDYAKYRPNYPKEIIQLLENSISFDSKAKVADIGSGTGLSSELFLNNGNKVYGIEPNNEIRKSAELLYQGNLNFNSVDGIAEQTSLEGNSVDLIFCGQAFHWFNPDLTKIEFARVLKLGGHIVLCWNQRAIDTPFLIAYEKLLNKSISSYTQSKHRNNLDEEITSFFAPYSFSKKTLPNAQYFDLKGLKGRLLSSSYCPKEGEECTYLMSRLVQLFKKHEVNGKVRFNYTTSLYISLNKES